MAWAPIVRAEEPSKEYLIKAAFIYNFTQFIEWPADSFASPDAPFIVGVAGIDPFNGALDQAFADKVVGSRKVVVKYFNSIAVIEPCQVLFISNSEERTLDHVFRRQLGTAATLTVGEFNSLLTTGGSVRFFSEGNKIRFEINLAAVDRARLKISSKLLKLAKVVTK